MPTGGFLGETGGRHLGNHRRRRAQEGEAAVEVWLFDKNDIRTNHQGDYERARLQR
jgi:hypothetical protein